MNKRRLTTIEAKAANVVTTTEILTGFVRPLFRAADASVTNAEHLASFKAEVLAIVSEHLNIPADDLREVLL